MFMETQLYEDMTFSEFERTRLGMKTDMMKIVITEHGSIWRGAPW